MAKDPDDAVESFDAVDAADDADIVEPVSASRGRIAIIAALGAAAVLVLVVREHLDLLSGKVVWPLQEDPGRAAIIYGAAFIGLFVYGWSVRVLARAGSIYIRSLAASIFVVSIGAAFAAMSAGFGYRWGVWDYGYGLLTILPASVFASLFVFVAATSYVASAVFSRTFSGAAFIVAAIVVAIAVTITPFMQSMQAANVPPIHDITTDMVRPPAFVDLLAEREGNAQNPAEYPGPEVAALQQDAYPEIKTIRLGLAPREALQRSLSVVENLGWDIKSIAVVDGRIEATETSFWFGFTDDIVVRVEPIDSGSKIDIRSKSRVGISDVGANAARIRKFLAAMTAPPK
jgi:uncharacterized protein (DUF1499 family)